MITLISKHKDQLSCSNPPANDICTHDGLQQSFQHGFWCIIIAHSDQILKCSLLHIISMYIMLLSMPYFHGSYFFNSTNNHLLACNNYSTVNLPTVGQKIVFIGRWSLYGSKSIEVTLLEQNQVVFYVVFTVAVYFIGH